MAWLQLEHRQQNSARAVGAAQLPLRVRTSPRVGGRRCGPARLLSRLWVALALGACGGRSSIYGAPPPPASAGDTGGFAAPGAPPHLAEGPEGSAGVGPTAGGPAAGSASRSNLVLLPEALPSVHLNRAITVAFTAADREGSELRFTVAAGELPPGLDLSAEGVLSGAPVSPGPFVFAVRGQDALGGWGEREYELLVRRCGWLALNPYTPGSSESAAVLADLAAPDRDLLVLEAGAVGPVRFSPDGIWATYASHPLDGPARQYLVEVSGAEPGRPHALDSPGELAWFDFAPDGSALAFTAPTSVSDPPVLALYGSSLESRQVGVPLWLGEVSAAEGVWPQASVAWTTPGTLAYIDSAQGLQLITWGTQGVESVEPLGIPAQALSPIASDGRSAVALGGEQAWLADFQQGSVEVLPPLTLSFSPDLTLALDRSTDPMELYGRVGTGFEEPLGAVPGTIPLLPEREIWAHRLPGLATLRESRVFVTSVSGRAIASEEVPGDYQDPTRFRFSPDDGWLAIGSANGAWLSRIREGLPEPAVRVADGSATAYQFSPDSRRVLLTRTAPVEIGILDLADPDLSPREIALDLRWIQAGWSPDSSYLWVMGGTAALDQAVWVVDLEDWEAGPRLVLGCRESASGPECPSEPRFQP